MNNLLVLSSSLSQQQGNSSQLTQTFVDKITSKQAVNITQHDLAKSPIDHLGIEELSAWQTEPEQQTSAQQKLNELSMQLIEEVKIADTLIIGIPMYNFGIPSTFKAWMDRIARAGVTFKYTDKGPVGLLGKKKVIIIATRGGLYKGTVKDSQTQQLKDFFALIGIEDIDFVYAEGLNMGQAESSFAQAHAQMDTLLNSI